MTGGSGRGGLGMRAGTFFSSAAAPAFAPLCLPLPRTLEVVVAAVAGEEEREAGEAPGASGSRRGAVDDSRRREGILDCDLAPGRARGVLVPARERGMPDNLCFFAFFVGDDNGEPGRFRFDNASPPSFTALFAT